MQLRKKIPNRRYLYGLGVLDNPVGPEPTFKEIAEHWRLHELRKEGIIRKKAVETVNCSEHNLDKYVLPRWGGCLAGSIRPSEVEGWFEVLATVAQGERKKPLKWPASQQKYAGKQMFGRT
jgi:hypothetical protein